MSRKGGSHDEHIAIHLRGWASSLGVSALSNGDDLIERILVGNCRSTREASHARCSLALARHLPAVDPMRHGTRVTDATRL